MWPVDEAAEEGCLVLAMTEGGVEEGATELRLEGIVVVVWWSGQEGEVPGLIVV